jgi:hypothetical protein
MSSDAPVVAISTGITCQYTNASARPAESGTAILLALLAFASSPAATNANIDHSPYQSADTAMPKIIPPLFERGK